MYGTHVLRAVHAASRRPQLPIGLIQHRVVITDRDCQRIHRGKSGTGVVDVELPTLPVFTAIRPIILPKFSASRTFQLVLSGTKNCTVYLDSATSLRGVQIKVFTGQKSTKPVVEPVLDEFGDVEFRTTLSCSKLRTTGVFVMRSDSFVRTRAIE